MGRNVATFLWRTLFIQAVCRHYVYTALELASVPLFTHMILKRDQEAPPLSDERNETTLHRQRLTHVVFGPGTDYNRQLMSLVNGFMNSESPAPQFEPQSFFLTDRRRKSIVNQQDADGEGYLDESQGNRLQPPTQFIPKASADIVADTCRKHLVEGDYIATVEKNVLCVWLPPPPPTAGAASLTYTLFVPVRHVATTKTVFPLGESLERETALEKTAAYQKAIELCHVVLKIRALQSEQDKKRGFQVLNENITTATLPGWIFGNSRNNYKEDLIHVLTSAFLIPLVRRINAIEREYSSGLAEHQGIMGLTDAEFFFGHFLNNLIMTLLESFSVMGLFYYNTENANAWAHDINPTLIAFSFILFAIGFSLKIVMVTWTFPKGWIGVTVAVLLWTSVPTFVTKNVDDMSLAAYFITPKWKKIAAAVFPSSALFSALRIIFISRDYENGGGGWSAVSKKALGKDNITVVEIWAVMLVTDFVMAFLALYLSKVLPWSTDNPQSPFFFFMPSYWKPCAGKDQDATPEVADPARFEELPAGTTTHIVAKNLTKVYGHKPALNGVDLKVYQSRITVLLGHNGAGKSTLMSILTGMQAPTSGKARVCGYDVTTHRSQVRQLVSFCQQNDIFFDNMTCVENLLYFGSLKGVPIDQLHESISSTLNVVDLQDKAYAMPDDLSGGMKRRLSIAITIVSQPKLLILDEPTAGMDPETRRHVWDCLQNVAKNTTLLLSSHDMDEADAIGDQVTIMASGRVICSGSTAFLKKACGVGYKLTLGKEPKTFNLKEVLAVIAKAAPMATVEDEKQGEVTIALKTLNYSAFPDMFGTLEGASQRLGIGSIGVSVASMKDVYLKINMDWSPEGKAQESPVEQKDIDAVTTVINKRRTVARSFVALVKKRFVSLIRSWGLLLGCVVLPLCLLALTSWLLRLPSVGRLQESERVTNTLPLSLAAHYPGSPIVLGESPATRTSARLKILLESEDAIVRKTTDIRTELGFIAEQDFSHYIATYPMAVAFENGGITVMPNPTSPVAIPLAMNLLATSMLREVTGQPVARITASITYFHGESVEAQINVSILGYVVWLYWALIPALSYSLAFAAYAAFPVPERMGGGRDVQLMTGMWGAEFVFAHFTFEMMHHALITGAWVLLHFAFSEYSVEAATNYYLVFLFSGPAIIGMSYLVAEKAVSIGGAISSLLLWVYLGGIMSIAGYGLAQTFIERTRAHYLFLAFPPYALLSCIAKIWIADAHDVECKLAQKASNQPKNIARPPATFVAMRGPFVSAASDGDGTSLFPDPCDMTTIYALNYDAMGLEILALLSAGLVFLGVMAFITSGYLPPGDAIAGKEVLADEDVEEEKKMIESRRIRNDFSEHTMLAWSLHKRYGELRAVRGVYVAMRPSECFGLLGVNGAGKTTTFQMLAGLESVSYGDAMTSTVTLSKNARKWQSQMSYCFQVGGLLDRLNAYEYLYLIGRLRGIADADLKPVVDSIVNVVDLKEHASKECGVYRFG